MVKNNQQSQITIIEKHKAKQFIFLDYKFDHRLKRRLATRRNLLPKFCGRWEAICCRGITAAWRLTRSAVRFHFWFQTQHFHSWTASASHFFWTRFASQTLRWPPRLLYAHSRSVAGHFSFDSWNRGWQPGAEQHLSAGADFFHGVAMEGLVRW